MVPPIFSTRLVIGDTVVTTFSALVASADTSFEELGLIFSAAFFEQARTTDNVKTNNDKVNMLLVRFILNKYLICFF